MTELISSVISRYMAHVNYWTITLLMTIESSFIPLPSELVMPPAGRKAADGLLNIYLVIISGTVGALLGALFNYGLALRLGRKIIYKLADTRIAHLMMINKDSVEKTEKYFRDHGNVSTFVGRLLPAVRHLISIPAGLAKMNIKKFMLYTVLGALLWNIILTLAGYFLKQSWHKIEEYNHVFKVIIYGIFGVLILFFVGRYLYRKYKKNRK